MLIRGSVNRDMPSRTMIAIHINAVKMDFAEDLDDQAISLSSFRVQGHVQRFMLEHAEGKVVMTSDYGRVLEGYLRSRLDFRVGIQADPEQPVPSKQQL